MNKRVGCLPERCLQMGENALVFVNGGMESAMKGIGTKSNRVKGISKC